VAPVSAVLSAEVTGFVFTPDLSPPEEQLKRQQVRDTANVMLKHDIIAFINYKLSFNHFYKVFFCR
jgi:hypothetical protein